MGHNNIININTNQNLFKRDKHGAVMFSNGVYQRSGNELKSLNSGTNAKN